MKNLLYKIGAFVAGSLLLSSCGNFGDVNTDPNNPSAPNTEFMFAYVCRSLPDFTLNGTYNPWTQMFPQYIAERQNVQYGTYGIPDLSMGDYYRYNLMDLKKIIDLNTNASTKNASNVTPFGSAANQIAVARTVTDFFFMHLTDALGMIPYSEALKGDSGNFTPKLDAQKDIYNGIKKDLKEAFDQFDASTSLNGTYDFIYNGDVSKWKKLNASIRLLMAIKLSDVDPTTGEAWFQEAYKDGAIEDNADNLIYPYYADANNENPFYTNIFTNGRRDFAPCSSIVDQMNTFNDPRREVYFSKNQNGIYKGIPLGLVQADITKYNQDNSDFNPNLYKQNSPLTIISAARILLVEAEAAVRGWISADPKTLYEQAVKTSMEAKGLALTDAELQAYLSQSGVNFTGSNDDKIKLIAMQRWINGYLEDGYEAWSDWRRLDYPKLYPGPAVTQWNHIPYRRTYSSNDISANQDQFNAAIKIQGADSYDTRVWWDVADNN